MTIDVIQGQGLIAIGIGAGGAYLRVRQPVTVVWQDCAGRGERYMCSVSRPHEDAALLIDRLVLDTTQAFDGDLSSLELQLGPLFRLFENGRYELSFDPGTRQDPWAPEPAMPAPPDEAPFSLWSGKSVYPEAISDAYDAYDYDEDDYDAPPAPTLAGTSTRIEPGVGRTYYYTDLETHVWRKERPELEIRAGIQPFGVLLRCVCPERGLDSGAFVIGGHEALAAYRKLEIQAPVLIITRVLQPGEQPEFDLEALREMLHPVQYESIRSCGALRPQGAPVLRSGPVQDYHLNGWPRRQGSLVNGLPDGELREWHPNGQLRIRRHFRQGVPVGTHISRYWNGAEKETLSYDDEGRLHGTAELKAPDGTLLSWQVWQHGSPEDGSAFSRWGHNGEPEYEYEYKGGIMIRRKSYDVYGSLHREEVYDEAAGKLGPVEDRVQAYFAAARERLAEPEHKQPKHKRPDTTDSIWTWKLLLKIALWILLALIWLNRPSSGCG